MEVLNLQLKCIFTAHHCSYKQAALSSKATNLPSPASLPHRQPLLRQFLSSALDVATSLQMPPPRVTVTLVRAATTRSTESTPITKNEMYMERLERPRTIAQTLETPLTAEHLDKIERTTDGSSSPSSRQGTRAMSMTISSVRVGVDESASSKEASDLYGAVPGSPTRTASLPTESRTSAKILPSFTRWSSSSSAEPGRVFTTSSHTTSIEVPSTSSPAPRGLDLSTPPAYAVYLLAVAISAGFLAAILLYFVNFPPSPGMAAQQGQTITSSRPVPSDGHNAPHGSCPDAAHSTAADSPNVTIRRRRNAKDLGVDVRAVGLGIKELDGLHDLFQQKSFDDDYLREKPLPGLPDHRAWQTFTAPLPAAKRFFHTQNATRLDLHHTRADCINDDLENGSPNPREDPDSDAPGNTRAYWQASVLSKLDAGIEYGAQKVASMFHQQVTRDTEEGLLLPIESVERYGHGRT